MDPETDVLFCRRATGRRRRHSGQNVIDETHTTAPFASSHGWIENSFLKAKQKITETGNYNHAKDAENSLNESDLILADIDVETIRTNAVTQHFSPDAKKMCQNLILSDLQKEDEKENKGGLQQNLSRKPSVEQNKKTLECQNDVDTSSKFTHENPKYAEQAKETSFDRCNNFCGEIDLFGDFEPDKMSPSHLSESSSEFKLLCSESTNNSVAHVGKFSDSCQNSSKAFISNCSSESSFLSNNSLHSEEGLSDSCHKMNASLDSESLLSTTRGINIFSSRGSETAHHNSLKNRLKQRLQQNSATTTPKNTIEEKLKSAAVQQAQIDASQIRKEGTKVDIGPFYGLPTKVKELFEAKRGITKLYDWQDECLSLPAIKGHKNLIFTLPTSGGKTLVAEILVMRELLCYHKDALLILPFVSIVQEKVRTISEFATDLEFLVEEYAGSKGRFPPIKRRMKKSLYIATIEKAHSLINSLLETERLENLGLVVVDELHMLGEGGSRGAALEATLLKILHAQTDTQIIGMSATLNNLGDMKEFLHADLYNNDFRPVSLVEYVKMEDNIYKVNSKTLCEQDQLEHSRVVMFPYSADTLRQDPDHILGLVSEVIPQNSCLVFCPTKKNCENLAYLLSQLIRKYQRHLSDVKRKERKQLLTELRQDGNGKICPVLEYTIHFGIAYHHSGLTMDERQLIEDAYSNGTLCLLTCTSTLAAGVNLPAKRVILRSPYVGLSFIKYSQYKQMTGRAGRAGIDSSGESILLTKKEDRMKVKELLSGPKDYCHSSLMYDDGKGIRSMLLSAIGLKIVTSDASAHVFMKKSLLSFQAKVLDIDMTLVTKDSLHYLMDHQLIWQKEGDSIEQERKIMLLDVTKLGKAVFKGSVDHQYSSQLYSDLKLAEQSLVLVTHLHLLYLVTPYDVASSITPDWQVYYKQYCKLSENELKVASVVGVREGFLSRKSSGMSSKQKVDKLAVNRFYLTLMLWDLWNQKSVWVVADSFAQSRGFVQNLMTQAASFASCVSRFCQELEEFWAYQDLLGNFVKRLSYCVTSELIPLVEVPGVKIARAKQLFSAGVTNLTLLAASEPKELAGSIEHLSRRSAAQIISAAKNLLEEKTAALMEEMDMLTAINKHKMDTK